MAALGSCLGNKYYEDLCSGRYYAPGNECINQNERLRQSGAFAAFNVDKTVWGVNVCPLSRSPASCAVYSALLQRHGRMMGLTLPDFGRKFVMSNGSFWGWGGPKNDLSDHPHCRTRLKRGAVFTARAERPDGSGASPEALDISVFRFTLGIPGFDDSDLPRVLGVLFGGLLIINHFFSLNSLTAAQLRSEGVGLVLAALSIFLPLIGRQLNGANKVQKKLEPGQKQIFCLADGVTDSQRQDLAWASYNLLRNTSTTAMLVWHSGQVVGARGFWGALQDSPGISTPLASIHQKLETNIEVFSNLKEPFYLPGNADGQQWDIIPRGTASLLVQPFGDSSSLETEETKRPVRGFLLLISNTPAGYRRKDRQWTASLSKKLSEVLTE